VKTHRIGNQVFGVHETSDKGGIWLAHFIWGKKDFRIYLSRKATAPGTVGPALLRSPADGDLVASKLQHLYNFDWYDFVKVADHGLASEKVLFRMDKVARYVELPKDFYDIAVEIACREFSMERQDRKRQLAG
jgi:hypothetical protein